MAHDTTSLLARLAAAPVGSRWLDEAVAMALGWERSHTVRGWWCAPDGTVCPQCPRYTTSLDATLELAQLPDVAGYWIECNLPKDCSAMAWIHVDEPHHAEANTQALALCIAVLRAKGIA